MPSPSLVLGSCSVLFSVLSFFSTPVRAADSYVLSKEYSGSTFFDEWDFFTGDDPNKGTVRYRDRNNARQQGLISTSNGDAFMRVDTSGPIDLSRTSGRDSVRIMSQQSFYHGLVVADIKHMPYGCGTWPAFWALGAAGNWPNSGEIDIIEGVNNRQRSLGVLHTGAQCKIAGDSRTMTGTLQNNDCFYDVNTGQGAVGCAILDDDTRSYGPGLAAAGGSVFAMEWTSDFIKIWSFPKGSVPSDIGAGQPNPAGWGLPAQIFNGPSCNIDDVIKPQKLIFNTNFCGDFGNAVWQSEGCAAQTGYQSCSQYVADKYQEFETAYWQIGSLKYYQLVAGASSTTTSTTSAAVISSTTPISSQVTSVTTPPAVTSPITTNIVVTITDSPTVITPSPQLTTYTLGNMTTVVTNIVGPVLTGPISTRVTTIVSTIAGTTFIDTSAPNIISPTLISTTRPTSGWEQWGALSATALTSAVPVREVVLPPPMGSSVPLTQGWDNIRPGQQPGVWLPATVTGARDEWSDSGKSRVITLTKTWIEPCETGYTTKTIHIVTKHCGCTETPVPTIPMKVITTVCPEKWGFKTPVVITVPDTPEATWADLPAKPTDKGKGKDAETWSVWASTGKVPDGKPVTWNDWSVLKPTPAASTAWAEWSTYKPAASSVQQPTWSDVPAAPTPTSSQGWAGLKGSSTPYIAKWEGAASRTSIGAGLLGFVVAVIAFVL